MLSEGIAFPAVDFAVEHSRRIFNSEAESAKIPLAENTSLWASTS